MSSTFAWVSTGLQTIGLRPAGLRTAGLWTAGLRTAGLWTAGAAVLGIMPKAVAQTSHYYAGLSVDGQQIMVDLFSPEAISDQGVKFIYALDNEQIAGQANCSNDSDARTWITLDDGVVHVPQSPATRNMLAVVCGYSTSSAPAVSADVAALTFLGSADSASVEDSPEDSPEDSIEMEESSLDSSDLGSSDLDSSEAEVLADSAEADLAEADSIEADSAGPAMQTALVFDPPSNVRTSPGGSILCSVEASTYINTYGHSGSWYRTDACGEMGVIDISQIQF
jgi:hypothetical protein